LLLGCSERNATEPVPDLCRAEATPIQSIQGAGWRSDREGETVKVHGVVTLVEADGAIYLQSPTTSDESASSALKVQIPETADRFSPGQLVALAGTVTELGDARDTLTALVDVTQSALCGEGVAMPLAEAALPLTARQREALEGMRVRFGQDLRVTDIYRHRYGEITLAAGEVLRVPTEIQEPGDAALRKASENADRSLVVGLPEASAAYPAGTAFAGLLGIMAHDGQKQQFRPEALPEPEFPAIPSLDPPSAGHVRIVSANLLNFFNGDGRGGGFPNERGAETPEDFERQKARLRSAMGLIRADLLAIQELENDGFGPDSAANDFLALLEESGGGPWRAVQPPGERIGGDVITVGLFYRSDVLEPVGAPALLSGGPFDGLSRQPLAQVFRDRASGETFLVASNHLKSKGRCPDSGKNADQEDGQGCWNSARTASVEAQVPWLEKLADRAGTQRILVLGDMNAWRLEDPIRRFRELGLVDLVERLSGLPQHSFLYWGQTGTLDYAFASETLAAKARRALIWNINASWPGGMDLPEPWLRMADHDPVVVDFDFSHSSTSD
jgi:predicted extracellular nuclease